MLNEEVILLDENYKTIGTTEKSKVHTSSTPLHLAFSTYIFNKNKEFLLTRRSLNKIAWPGVWTNSACGHPLPGECFEDAIARRVSYELNMKVRRMRLMSDSFSYQAIDASGIKENEYCPVFAVESDTDVLPEIKEVMDYKWVTLETALEVTKIMPYLFSPWMVLQLKEIRIINGLHNFIAN